MNIEIKTAVGITVEFRENSPNDLLYRKWDVWIGNERWGDITRFDANNWKYDAGCYIREYQGWFFITLVDFMKSMDYHEETTPTFILEEK